MMMAETFNVLAHYVSIYLLLLFLAAWRALPLLAIALVAGLFLRRRLAPKCHAILWSLVVLRALMPVSIGSHWSVQGAIDQVAAGMLNDNTPIRDLSLPTLEHPAQNRFTNLAGIEIKAFRPDDHIFYRIDDLQSVDQQVMREPIALPPRTNWTGILFTWLLAAVAGVTISLVLRSIVAHVRFARKLSDCRSIEDVLAIKLLQQECRSLQIAPMPAFKEVPELSTPAVFGLWRSTICLPIGALQSLSHDELRWVLRHELAHVSRCDSWLMSVATIAQSLHWFNPLAWLTTAKLRAYVEAAADALAVGLLPTEHAQAYGHLLLRIAEQSSGSRTTPTLGLLPFTSARNLKQRIEWLTQSQRSNRTWTMFVVGAMIVTLAAATLTDAVATPKKDNSELMVPMVVGLVQPTVNAKSIPTHPRKFDVAAVLDLLGKDSATIDPKMELLSACRMLAPSDSWTLENNDLSAQLTDKQFEDMSRLLEAWANQGAQQISVEIRSFQADMSHVSHVDWSANGLTNLKLDGTQPMIAAKLSDADMRTLILRMQADQRSIHHIAPKVTLFNGQTSFMIDAVKRSFITAVQNGELASQVEQLDDGLIVHLSPKVTGPKSLDLAFDLKNTKIGKVAMAHLPAVNNGGMNPVVQVPARETTSAKGTLSINSNETILLVVPQLFTDLESDTNMAAFYTITPRILDLD